MPIGMDASQLALVQGVRDTRATLLRWNAAPWAAVRPWLIGAVAISAGLLGAVIAIGSIATPDATPVLMPGLNEPVDGGAVADVLYRNSLVLALHAMACVAGFIAGSSVPLQAQRHTGLTKKLHDRAGPLAIAFVICATTFSLATQAYVLGNAASTLAAQGHIAVPLLVVGILPHAVPELIALFLPLAAWIIASRRKEWHELLAATFVTVGIAAPILVLAAFTEVYVSPHVILWLRG
jgi:multisubunit Na+/H+ antiporter MnhC subunit